MVNASGTYSMLPLYDLWARKVRTPERSYRCLPNQRRLKGARSIIQQLKGDSILWSIVAFYANVAVAPFRMLHEITEVAVGHHRHSKPLKLRGWRSGWCWGGRGGGEGGGGAWWWRGEGYVSWGSVRGERRGRWRGGGVYADCVHLGWKVLCLSMSKYGSSVLSMSKYGSGDFSTQICIGSLTCMLSPRRMWRAAVMGSGLPWRHIAT